LQPPAVFSAVKTKAIDSASVLMTRAPQSCQILFAQLFFAQLFFAQLFFAQFLFAQRLSRLKHFTSVNNKKTSK
jgi:hypothetical protein